MDVEIRAPNAREVGDAYDFDDSFTVESELILSAEGGVARFEVVPVVPYGKRYGRADLSGRRDAPDRRCSWPTSTARSPGGSSSRRGGTARRGFEDIAVDARRRRAGVGRALMDRAITWAVERGLAGVRLETQSNNVPACRFYESCGFHLGGFDRDLYRGLDGVTTEVALFWYLPLNPGPPPKHTPVG